MSWGVTETGFSRKRYEDLLEDMQTTAVNLFGANVDLSDGSPLGKIIKVAAFTLSLIWQIAEAVYSAAYIDTASQQSLDYLVKQKGLRRRAAVKATGNAVFAGDEGTVIPKGTLITTATGEPRFVTTASATIPSSGSVTIGIEAETPGEIGNVGAGAITVLVNPIPGVTAVTNTDPTSGGLEEETDYELRERYFNSLATGTTNTDAIHRAVSNVTGVNGVIVYVNDTINTDAEGRPPKSVEVVVNGGSDADVAQAIFDSKAGGIQAWGGIAVQITDLSGNIHSVGFSRPTPVDIYWELTITTNAEFPADGDQQVINAIVNYTNGLKIGEDVIRRQAEAAALKVIGVVDVTAKLDKVSPPTGETNIAIAPREVAKTDATKVTIVHA